MMNNLRLKIYSTGTTPIYDGTGDLRRGSGLWFSNGYPTGSLAGGLFVPRHPDRWWEVKGTLRVAILNGQQFVYEGFIPDLESRFTNTALGTAINFIGPWGWYLMKRNLRKRWADDRVDEQTWEWMTTAATYAATEKCTIDRQSRLRFLPKSEAWTAGDFAAVRYTMPTGETIKRLKLTYKIASTGANWSLIVYDITNTATVATYTQTGSGDTGEVTIDLVSGTDFTASQIFELRYKNASGSTPASNGSEYCNITDLMVYSENEGANGIHLNSVAADVLTAYSALLNSDTSHLEATANLRAVEPFITDGDGYETLADILTRLTEFGDSNNDRLAVGIKYSDQAATPDGKPVLFTAAWPTLADYDYFIPRDKVESLNIVKDYAGIVNYLQVGFTDAEGKVQWITPDDESELTDAASVAEYGTREVPGGLLLGNSTHNDALEYGKRYLAEWKDPKDIVSSGIDITGYITGKYGEPIDASLIQTGKAVKLESYDDPFLVSVTNYDHDSITNTLSLGRPNPLVFNATRFAPVWNDIISSVSGGYTDGGGGGGDLGFVALTGLEDVKKSDRALFLRIKAEALAYRRKHGGNLKNAVRKLGHGKLMKL